MGEFTSYFGGVILMVIFIILIVLMGFFFRVGSVGDAMGSLTMNMEEGKIFVPAQDFMIIKMFKTFFRGLFISTLPGIVFII